jgi:hypothetical protein
MPSPTGSVVALSSAASTVFSIGIVFLGYWGVHESSRWAVSHVFVVGFALAGFACASGSFRGWQPARWNPTPAT